MIENAKRIGVLPKNIADIIQNDLYHSAEMEIERINEDRLKEKKKKHRSGSLTRMFFIREIYHPFIYRLEINLIQMI